MGTRKREQGSEQSVLVSFWDAECVGQYSAMIHSIYNYEKQEGSPRDHIIVKGQVKRYTELKDADHTWKHGDQF